MATILLEGFDKYGPANINLPNLAASLAQGGWNLTGGGLGTPADEIALVAGLSGSGSALQVAPNGTDGTTTVNVNKALGANYTQIIGGFRFSVDYPRDSGSIGIVLTDNATAQCTINVQPLSGFIAITEGNNGTVIATSTTAVAYNTVHYLEFAITFGTGSSGSYSVWLDGVQILVGTGPTQQSAHAYCNVVQFVTTATNSVVTSVFDDMYLFDDTTSFNNTALLTSPLVLTQWPTADHQTQFTNIGNAFGNTYSANTSSYSDNANSLYLAPFVPNVNCTVNSIVVSPTTSNIVANFKGVIYSASGALPNALLSSGTQVTGCTAGMNLNLPLVTPQALTAGTTYWIGLINDTTTGLIEFDGTIKGYTAANAYSGGAPSTAPTMTPNQSSILLFGACTGAATNWESEALNPPIGDTSTVTTATPTTEDLYSFPNLPGTITQVYSVAVSGNSRLVAGGSHTIDLVISSNGTIGVGSDAGQAPTNTYAWYNSYFDVDPHTTTTWSTGAVNVAYAGMEAVT
jgi:hypothetical protein